MNGIDPRTETNETTAAPRHDLGMPGETAPHAALPTMTRLAGLAGPGTGRSKSPALACVLSAMPGLGQVYVGYYPRGFAHSIFVAAVLSLLVTESAPQEVVPLLTFFLVFFWLYNIIDAGRRAALVNEALIGQEAIDLPSDFRMPSFGGSIFGGLLLIGGGAILLSNTLYGASLAWVGDWWPAGGILVGVYLLVRGILDRMREDQPGRADRS